MPETHPSRDASPLDDAARCSRVQERILAVLMLYALAGCSEALAANPALLIHATQIADLAISHRSSLLIIAAPPAAAAFSTPAVPDRKVYSATDFSPRKHTVFDDDPSVNAMSDAPVLHTTTIWQRMAQYKSHDRVRLLTLWESSGSIISLQAGKRGEPSLQWSSRRMNRGGATRGLLDHLFSVSLADAGHRLREVARTAPAPQAAPKPAGVAGSAGREVR